MSSTSFELLYQAYLNNKAAGDQLWVLTDSLADTCSPLTAQASQNTHPTTHLLTNRWDIAQQAPGKIHFNDYDLTAIPNLSHVYFHIPKEKPVLNHLLNQCSTLLSCQGRVFIAGEKNQGIKSVGKNAKSLFTTIATQKYGDLYLSELAPNASTQNVDCASQLNDQDYPKLRGIGELNQQTLFSKPGIYGWNKIDAGSAVLVDYLRANQVEIKSGTHSVLDLGCGYGYLSLAAHQIGLINLHATDNNAGAIQAVKKTARHNGFEIQAWPDDVAASCQQTFDLIVCNPPFHQGFEHSKALSTKFCRALARLLAPGGQALVIVNQFIKLENFTAGLFNNTQAVAGDKSYTVYRCTKH